MSIALDIGTSRLRSVRREGDELVGRSVPATFALVADDPSARELLSRADIGFAVGEGELALVGEAALRHAATFRSTPLRLLPGGLVPADDPPARQILGMLVESLLPEADTPGGLCGLCGLILSDAAITDKTSREFISRLVWMRGYEPVLLSATHAIALATLSTDGFTGVALSLGAGGCSLGLIHRSRELAFGSDSRGTDWIDARLAAGEKCFTYNVAGERYLDTESIRRRRESLGDPLNQPAGTFGVQVADRYRELLESTLTSFADRLAHERLGPFAGPLTVVCAGGGARAAGFAELVSSLLASTDLPFDVDAVRVHPSDDYLVARGGLIHAELEVTCAAA
ncbi:MAG: hypothetical protein WBC44_04055 [Planctomycetaceae bacterium]